MEETSHEPAMVWLFVRRHFVRTAIGAVLIAAAYGVVSVYATYHREQRIVRKIESLQGEVMFDWVGPDWIPQSVQDRLPFLNRIYYVRLMEAGVIPELILELESPAKLRSLGLFNTDATDADMEHLKVLTKLKYLYLNDTRVADAGVEHFKGLTSLVRLNLNNTRVTAEGRATLQRALPNCKIEPNL